MEKYLIFDWPESQKYIGKKGCIHISGGKNTAEARVAVPEDVFLRTLGKGAAAESLLKRYSDLKDELRSFIAKNVPKGGLKLTKGELQSGDCRIDCYNHFTGETERVNVERIYPGRIEGTDDYGNSVDRCSLATDVSTDALYDLANFLFYHRKKTRI